MGSADGVIRTAIAAIILLLKAFHVISGTLAIVLLVIAGIFILTSVVSFCPLYSLFGINTCKKKNV